MSPPRREERIKMDTTNPSETNLNLDQWALHEELGKEYARQREMRGGKTIRQLVAEANAPWFLRRRRPGSPRRGRKP